MSAAGDHRQVVTVGGGDHALMAGGANGETELGMPGMTGSEVHRDGWENDFLLCTGFASVSPRAPLAQ